MAWCIGERAREREAERRGGGGGAHVVGGHLGDEEVRHAREQRDHRRLPVEDAQLADLHGYGLRQNQSKAELEEPHFHSSRP